jgi:hypothetical protein
MQLLLSRAGLVLNPGQVADLVLAWRQVAGLIASIPHDRALVDDMALAFRLPPPASATQAAAPKAKRAASPGRPVAKPKKAAPKHAVRKAAGKRAPPRR